MPKKWAIVVLIVVIIAISLFGILSNGGITGKVVANQECLDSDNTINGDAEMGGSVYVKGEVRFGENVFQDNCDGNTVNERACEEGSVVTLTFDCDKGCSDGACLWVRE